MTRVHNFNAGPAALPLVALEQAQRELIDFEGTGMSILEHSHRGKAFEAVHDEALSLVRKLLGVPDTHDILLLQGGAHAQFAMIPMNLLPAGKSADYVLTDGWSDRAFEECKNVGGTRLAGKIDGYTRIPRPDELSFDPAAAYVHVTSNGTLSGTQWQEFPTTAAPLVADMSSDILSRPIDVSKFGLIYAGAQKNIGPSGITIVIIRKDLIASARTDIPKYFRYSTHSKERSLYNTPPTFSIYLARNVLRWLESEGGVAGIAEKNRKKTDLLYAAIDARPDFFRAPVDKGSRSRMNVVFRLPTEALDAKFCSEAERRGIVGLKGHRSVGGVRASTYNAVPLAAVEALVAFMEEFAASEKA